MLLDLPELPRHRGSDYSGLGQDIEQNILIDMEMLPQRNGFCDRLHIKAEEKVYDQLHLNA